MTLNSVIELDEVLKIYLFFFRCSFCVGLQKNTSGKLIHKS